jgi:outer membrane protein assembly factor BamB
LFSAAKVSAADNPYPPGAPWPVMRGNLQNTGMAGNLKWAPDPSAPKSPVRFSTGNGIFSTPVIDAGERVYVGSADHFFYAVDPKTGKTAWKFDALELIDSAAALASDGRVYVPAGAAIFALDPSGKKVWAFDVTNNRPKGLYTFGTNYWWEGNVVVGPDKNIYSGNDDFFFYSINPDGAMRWAHRTGLHIWAIPAFASDGSLYFSGFDMRLYSLDQATGKLKWKKNLKNPLVASPALGPDGTLYQGSFDGNLYAIDSRNGKIKWTFKTASHIYASAAVDKNNLVYVTSTDGFLYAIDGKTGKARWTFYTGDAIRSSPALGPDPEAKSEYLIYFGGGQGDIYAIDPDGNRRWSYSTLVLTGRVDYPNINASPALGKSGVAIASSNGDIFYLPYDYYLQAGASGITRDPTDGFREDGARFHYVAPGGLIDQKPESAVEPKEARPVHASQSLILRLLYRKDNRTVQARLVPESVRAELSPDFKHRLEIGGDTQTVVLIPEEFLSPGKDYLVRIEASFKDEQGTAGEVSSVTRLSVAAARQSSPLLGPGHPSFAFERMAFPQPPIVPSMDQIGIQIMRIPFAVVETNPADHTFIAWAVQKYGAGAGGEEQGIPDSRSLFYAFSGKTLGDYFSIESKNCFFEESSFPFPLDLFRLSGRINPDGTVEQDASLLAELDPPGILATISKLSVSSEEQSSGQQNWLGSAISGAGMSGFFSAAAVSGPTVVGYITNKVWKPWELYNYENRMVSTGTFRMERLPEKETQMPAGVNVKKFEYDPGKKQVVAEVDFGKSDKRMITVGILLVDNQTHRPVPINYNTEL